MPLVKGVVPTITKLIITHHLHVQNVDIILARVYKEGKRVSNALCTVCNMYVESHAPRIQILTNQNARLGRYDCGRSLECSMNEH